MKVFLSVLPNSRSIRYSYSLYQISPNFIRAAALVLYGLKCYLSLLRIRRGEPQLLYFASYPNEHRVLGHIRDMLQTNRYDEISISLRNCVRPTVIWDTFLLLPAVPRLYRFAARLAGRYDFMPACRIFSTVAYYKRFNRLLDEQARAVFIACQYSPECLGLAAATHRAGKKVLFTNHANATGESRCVPPIHADLVAVTSEALSDIYRRHSPNELNIVPLTNGEPQSEMRVPVADARSLTLGIYLTALTSQARLIEIVAEWSRLPAFETIVIRCHPAEVVNADLGELGGVGVRLELSRAMPLSEDIRRTDVAVCGNSTVATEILRGGRPVLYDHRLDKLAFDYNGYAGEGLVSMYPKDVDDGVFDLMRRHYVNEAWLRKMRYFDTGYQNDEEQIARDFAAAVSLALQSS